MKSVLGVGFDLAFELHPAKRVLSFDLTLGFTVQFDIAGREFFLSAEVCVYSP
ncbi:hypothetical protein OQE50_24120 (plasmid) [Enterobacter kobei]|uniref:hypothetical protein n=1 Tax=Enterobacter kobei TaxID=208224 RepID=UPI00224A82CA|nr:hypothetical protein [Enterobacter kobei]UZQ70265.1 hypothetical protein OQE50_24120 [Enterobacter kobei]